MRIINRWRCASRRRATCVIRRAISRRFVRSGELVEAEGPAIHRAARMAKIADRKRLLDAKLLGFKNAASSFAAFRGSFACSGSAIRSTPIFCRTVGSWSFPVSWTKPRPLYFAPSPRAPLPRPLRKS